MGLIPSRNPWQRRTIMLQVDMSCIHCSYNLRGLAISSDCPECGRSVWDSLLNRSVPAFYGATRTAASLCALASGTPILIAALMAMGGSRSPVEAMVVTLVLASFSLIAAGLGWFTLAVDEFRPTSSERLAITLITLLAIAGIVTSTLIPQVLPAVYAPWLPRAWDATLTALCAYLMLIMSPAARLIFVLQRPIVARLIQTAQIACLIAGTACFGSLMLELTRDAGWFRPVAWRSAAIAGICVILCMALASHAAGSARSERRRHV